MNTNYSGDLFSIIIPCFNQSEFLNECLESVIKQTYQNWECIIVNDGSEDDTELVSNKWVKKSNKIKYVYQNNRGLSSARNKGISIAQGVFILPLDADDKISDDYLSLSFKAFKKNNDLKLVYCLAKKFGIVNSFWHLQEFSLSKIAENNVIFCSAIYRKSDWSKIGGYDEEMKYGLEDWEFWINLLKNGGDVYRINKVCFFYRVKAVSMITNLTAEKEQVMLDYMHNKHKDFFIKNYLLLISKKNKEIYSLKSNLRSKKFMLNKVFQLMLKDFSLLRKRILNQFISNNYK